MIDEFNFLCTFIVHVWIKYGMQAGKHAKMATNNLIFNQIYAVIFNGLQIS